jgi:hypothetical protein
MSNNTSSKLSTSSERVSVNSKAILLGLFALVGFILLVFTITLRFVPIEQTARLNTVYVAAVSGILALGGTLISQLWGKNNTTKTATNSPVIFSTQPEDTSIAVPLDTSIGASFNTQMDKSTINSGTFTLKENSTNSNIDGTISLIGGNAIFKPTSPLKPSTKYTATITKEAKDVAGNSLDANKEWLFTTVDRSP